MVLDKTELGGLLVQGEEEEGWYRIDTRTSLRSVVSDSVSQEGFSPDSGVRSLERDFEEEGLSVTGSVSKDLVVTSPSTLPLKVKPARRFLSRLFALLMVIGCLWVFRVCWVSLFVGIRRGFIQ